MRTLLLLAVVATTALAGCCHDRCSYKVPAEYFPAPNAANTVSR